MTKKVTILIGVLVVLFLAVNVYAGTPISLYQSFAGNLNYTGAGGTLRTDSNSGDSCAVTTSGSASLSGIPSGATVRAAFLYWAGSYSTDGGSTQTTPDYDITFNSTNISADRTFTETFNYFGTDYDFFSGFADVTSNVIISGANTFSNLEVNSGSPHCDVSAVVAGWALVVVYEDPGEDLRVVNIFDGFQYHRGSSVSVTPNNFRIPDDPINGKMSHISWEGDVENSDPSGGFTEQLHFNGNGLGDGYNPSDNQFNSTVNTLGINTSYGVDFDTYDISAYLSEGDESATSTFSTGGDLVLLSAEVISVTNTPVADLEATKAHTGDFIAGQDSVYTVTVTNNGPSDTEATDTITLVDTLPTELTYVSSSGSGWTEDISSLPSSISWTYTGTAVAAGDPFPPITLTVNPDVTAMPAVTNTAVVSSTMFDNIAGNDTVDDITNVVESGLSASTMTVSDLNGGDAEPGDVLRYTITLVDSSGNETSGVQVAGDISANTTDFSIIAIPVGATDNSLPAYLDISDITVPASGSVVIIFDVTVASGTLPGTEIDHSVNVDIIPSGTSFTISSPTITVSESLVSSSGNKPLYLYSSPNDLSRTPPSTSQSEVTINGDGNSDTWTMTPVSQSDIIIDGSSGSIPVVLWLDESGRGSDREVTVELRIGTTVIGSDTQTHTLTTTPQEYTFNIPVSGDIVLSSGDAITLYIENATNRANRRLVVSPTSGSENSRVDMISKTVINVDSIDYYDAAYPGGAAINLIKQGETIYVRSVISDPFGSFDIASAALDIIDSDNLPVILSEPMTNVEDSGAAYSTWELGLDIAAVDPTGIWTARVTTVEGTEGFVTHSISDTFRVVSNITSVEFIDANGNLVNGYPMDTGSATAYIRVVDESANLDAGAIDSVVVTVSDSTTSDSEDIILWETGPDTGVFESAGFTISTSAGTGLNDGTLYVIGGYNIDVAYGTLNDTAFIPTLAIISSFRTMVEDGNVVVEWETASEIGTIGFNLFRKDDGKFIRLNDRLLPGLLVSAQGGTYRFVDTLAAPGITYTYKLVEKEVRGRKRVHGPYTVTAVETVSETSYEQTRRMSIFSEGNNYLDNRGRNFSRKSAEKSELKKMRVKARQVAKGAVRRFLFPWQRNKAKISISDSGFYYLSSEEIEAAFGISTKTAKRLIRQKRLSLTTQGEPVPWKRGENNNGILFFGQAIDSIYTNENIYWLNIGRGSVIGSTRSEKPEYDPEYDTGTATFTCNIHEEENKYALTAYFEDPHTDYWMWDYIAAGSPGVDSKIFTITADGAAQVSGTASLSINLKGATDDAECDTDHHVMVSINGIPAGEGFFDGTSASTIEISFDQLLLDDGENIVEITGLADTGAAFSIFYVNSFDLSYQRKYRAFENMLRFTGDENETVTITGFTSSDIMVFDISDPKNPVALKGIIPGGSEGDYGIRFNPSDDACYVALASDGFKKAISVDGRSRSWLKERWNSADYIVIAPSELSGTAEFLCEYRRQQGLETMVVELSDIMDAFNHGIFNPGAIKDFISYAYYEWRKPPQYIVLAGDGTYDYKNFGGHDDNLIPPFMVRTPDGLFASDSKFGDIEGNDGVPEVSVGRLPVITSDELLYYIEKIKAYETSGGINSSTRVMMLADNPDSGGAFAVDSNEIASLLPTSLYAEKIYLGAIPLDDARTMIIEGMKNGTAFVNYMGHGALDRFAAEGMLTSGDVPILEGSGEFPVVAAMTCVAGRFSMPGFDCIGEKLVLAEDGGAAAVWSPTGFSMNSDARILNEEFIKILFQQKEKVLGKAVLRAYKAYGERGCESNLPLIYSLLGDPALNVR